MDDRPCTMVRICDECNYGSYEGRCVICGGMGISDAFYCKVRPLGKSKFSKFLWPFAWLFSLAVASILPLLPCPSRPDKGRPGHVTVRVPRHVPEPVRRQPVRQRRQLIGVGLRFL